MIVFIASGEGFPDALTAGVAAAKANGTLLLTRGTRLPAETTAALNTLKPTEIVIVGGTGVISAEVETTLKSFAFKPTVSRVAGANRYETAAKMATR